MPGAQGPKTVKGAQSDSNYVSRLLARSECLPGGPGIIVTPPPPDPTWKRPPGRPRTKWTGQLRRDNNNVPIATLWRQLLVAVTRELRYGPSRLRVNDDDERTGIYKHADRNNSSHRSWSEVIITQRTYFLNESEENVQFVLKDASCVVDYMQKLWLSTDYEPHCLPFNKI